MILCDTQILIEFYKGNPYILEAFRSIGPSNLAISAYTLGELYYGAKDKRELRIIQGHLSSLAVLPLDSEISTLFTTLLETYAIGNKLSIPNAFIAATAIHHNLPLYTLNARHFRFIGNLKLHIP
jgi:tRNA(fMet)-specific endonuclease VapC